MEGNSFVWVKLVNRQSEQKNEIEKQDKFDGRMFFRVLV